MLGLNANVFLFPPFKGGDLSGLMPELRLPNSMEFIPCLLYFIDIVDGTSTG
jgi:hypothetical protein